MPKNKTSVLFINTGRKPLKPVSIPTTLLYKWKKYIFYLIVIIITLIGVTAWYVYDKTGTYYKAKLATVDKKLQNLSKAVDINKLKKSFESIDSGMSRINIYLQQKGINEIKTPNAGGVEAAIEVSDLNGIADFYKDYINGIDNTIEFTPLGVPHQGQETSNFGYRHNPFTGGGVEIHPGIDFKGNIGDPVKATANGKVIFSGPKGGYGNCVILEHANNFQTLFGHLSRVLVREGQEIKAGYTIGLLGNSGRSTGPHIHYEIIHNGQKINPESFLKL
jgi:murein DD-endopeptidase MepM/ murein hydrolase activator NlpD